MKNKKHWMNSKTFWKNFSAPLIIFTVIWLFLSFDTGDDLGSGGAPLGLLAGYIMVSIFAIIYSCYRIGKDYVISDNLDLYRCEKGMEWKEFREKYGEIMNIYDDN